MPLPNVYAGASSGATASSTDYDNNWILLESSFLDAGAFIVSGLMPTAGVGLAVVVTSGKAVIGAEINMAASFNIAGLTNNSVNFLYLLQTGSGTSNTTGIAPANSVFLGTATTVSGSVTGISLLGRPQSPLAQFFYTDPTTQSWAGTNMSGASLTTHPARKALFLAVPSHSGDSIREQTVAVPSTPYVRTLGFLPSLFATNYQLCGMMLSDGTKLITFDCTFNSALNSQAQTITVSKWTNNTTFSATYATTPTNIIATPWQAGPCMWFQIQDNGTNRTYWLSNDGYNFQQILSTTSADFLTPTLIGFYCDCNTTATGCGITVLSWA